MTEVLVRNNRTTTDSFVTDAMLQDWLRQSHTWACAFKKWPFTEGRVSTTFASVEEWSFEGLKADTVRFIQVGGKRHQKINFEDYQIYREEQSSGQDRIFTDFGRLLLVNPNTDATGTLVAYGQYQPIIDPTDLAAETLFSSWDAEGNEAIVEKMSAFLKRREHLADEAEVHDQRASNKLTEVYERIGDEQFAYHDKGEGMWERIDVIDGGLRDELFKRDQFN